MMASLLAVLTLAAAVPSAPVPQVGAPVPVAGNPIGYLTAGDLAERCGSGSPAGMSYCYAFITGVHDTMRAYEAWLNQREFCVPANTPQSDLRRAFLTYLSAYPTNRGGQASSVVVVALKETYPCTATSIAPAVPREKAK